MKKQLVLAVVSISMMLVYAAAGLAEEATPPAAQAPAPAAKTQTEMKKGKLHSISGEIVTVDANAKTVTVKTKKEEVTLNFSDKTKITSGKEKATFADLKSGEHVRAAAAEEDGKLMAHAIRVIPAKPASDAGMKMPTDQAKPAAPGAMEAK